MAWAVAITLVLAGCGTSGASGTVGCPDPGNAPGSHLAPELEALVPKNVAGRDLKTWSLSGQCWVGIAGPAGEALKSELEAASSGIPVDMSQLGYAVAGRADVDTDPPYFVWAAMRPDGPVENALAVALLFGTADYEAPLDKATDLSNYDPLAIGEKMVFVGSVDMIAQNEHQRGSPYLYQNDDYMFIVLTDDPAWAEEALTKLP